jgi:cytochrome bd-type quinol oxidase subunit 2
MIPFSITIDEAASPQSSLAFMFWGAGLVVFPLTLLYTAVSYSVFRGKVRSGKTDDCRFHTRKLGGSSATILG